MAGMIDNLTEVENLTAEVLMDELKTRYMRDCIYTYVGEILVAMNPYKTIDGIYSTGMMSKYKNLGDRGEHPPHIFAVADSAYASMVSNSNPKLYNQVCVISGESGAGKTESAKLFVKQIIALSSGIMDKTEGGTSLEDKIVQLNPLLEAWGNAHTLRNDNSSRFGKFTELRFNGSTNTIMGAVMSEYLLEKSRVISQTDGERNFHIFYLFFAGLTAEEKSEYQVNNAGDHCIIKANAQAIAEVNGKTYKDMAQELKDCMEIVGFSEEEQHDLKCILSAVLHFGDVEIGGDEKAYIVNADTVLKKVSNQLSVDHDSMQSALLSRVDILRGENVVREYKEYESMDCRDATSKALYSKTFSWIVKSCNSLLVGTSVGEKTYKSIGILDIFGFECFDLNSLEQMLINLANEQLQFFFNEHIFQMELSEYAKEGIDGSTITYEDNKPLLEMMLSKPLGLISILDEESLFPRATDGSMIEKLHQNLGEKPGYTRPRSNEQKFTVTHYAGPVLYTAEGFLEKNRDTLATDIVAVMRLSGNSLVNKIFGADADDLKSGKAKKDAKKNMRKSMKKIAQAEAKTKKTTVSTEFKNSLAKLMEEMSRASPHFIRCVKPNERKKPRDHDDDLVAKQLRYCGMLETTRIRKEGFPQRPTFQDFLDRYKVLGFGFAAKPPANAESCAKILAKAQQAGWQVGKTKVFLRYWHSDKLNELMRPFPAAAKVLQKYARGFIARRKLKKLKEVAARERKAVLDLITRLEKAHDDQLTVMQALCDEDNARPAEFWEKNKAKKTKEIIADPVLHKMKAQAQKKGGVTRAASVRWFKEVEMKKGAGVGDGGGFQEWFHGIITRIESEELLLPKPAGTFLVRVAESRFGYSLSHTIVQNQRVKHYMIDQTPEGQYLVVGNPKLFSSLNGLVDYHSAHKVISTDPVALLHSCGQEGDHDDTAELMGKKKK